MAMSAGSPADGWLRGAPPRSNRRGVPVTGSTSTSPWNRARDTRVAAGAARRADAGSAARTSRKGLGAALARDCARAAGAATPAAAARTMATATRRERGVLVMQLLLDVLADLGIGLARLALRHEARVEAGGHAAEPRVDVEPLDLLDAPGDPEHVLRRLQLAALGGLEAGELEDAASLGEPDLLAAEGLDQGLGAGRAEAVDVRVVVDAADRARALVVVPEGLDVAGRRAEGRVLGARVVGLVEHVGRDDRAALEDLARDGGEARRRLRILVGRLREVVDLVPRDDVLDVREALLERLQRALILLRRRQLALDLPAVLALVADRGVAARVLERHERRDPLCLRGADVRGDAIDLVVALAADRVPGHDETRLLDAEIREQRVREHLRVVLGDADGQGGLGSRRDRQQGDDGQHEGEQTRAHDRGAGSFRRREQTTHTEHPAGCGVARASRTWLSVASPDRPCQPPGTDN